MHLKLLLTLLLTGITGVGISGNRDLKPNKVTPTEKQIKYQKMEMVGFIHFSINTFTDKEWGYGDESPQLFNPTRLDAEQWVVSAKAAGIKELILTAKHHDGFCLWPSAYTEHSIKNSPYKGGKGDIVREFTDACRKHDIKIGLYLSPWDRNASTYGTEAYVTYYRNQLTELLTKYGTINEIWFDGANGGDGYYGGAREVRKIDKRNYYRWNEIHQMIYTLQPGISIFSDAGPDIHWIGNESGYAGESFWSMITAAKLVPGESDSDYLNSGDPEGSDWIIGQCDVSIRPGWFYHQKEDNRVRTPAGLVDLYYKSVGRNAVFLLNIPPTREGLFHATDVKHMKEFREILDETFKQNLLSTSGKTAAVATSSFTKKHAAKNLIDNDPESYWAASDDTREATVTITTTPVEFDRLLLQEPIRLGQRISAFEVEALVGDKWTKIATGTTIGYKRLLRFAPVKSGTIRIRILSSNNTPALSNLEVYKASSREIVDAKF